MLDLLITLQCPALHVSGELLLLLVEVPRVILNRFHKSGYISVREEERLVGQDGETKSLCVRERGCVCSRMFKSSHY